MLLKPGLAVVLAWVLRLAVVVYPVAIFRWLPRLRSAGRVRPEVLLFGLLSLVVAGAGLFAWTTLHYVFWLAPVLWFATWPLVFSSRWIPERPFLTKSVATFAGVCIVAIAVLLYPATLLRGEYRRFDRVELGKGYACETHVFVDMWGGERSFFVARDVGWLPLSRIIFEGQAEYSETAWSTAGTCSVNAAQSEILLDFDGKKKTIAIE